jgi:hypothetical protein
MEFEVADTIDTYIPNYLLYIGLRELRRVAQW